MSRPSDAAKNLTSSDFCVLHRSVKPRRESVAYSGLNNQMWAAIVDRDGNVCAVAFSGMNRGAEWV